MLQHKGKWGPIKKVEFATLCVFCGWMLTTLALWWTPLLEKQRTVTIFSLIVCFIIYLLLGTIRKIPQFRFVPNTLPPESAEHLVRLRVLWTAELRLIFAGGFAGTALTLPFSNALRRAVAGLFLLALISSLVSFLWRWRVLSKTERSPE